MARYYNITTTVFSFLGGIATFLLGGWDSIAKALVLLMLIDYITGIIKALSKKELSSKIGFSGILKKVGILSLVFVSVICESYLGILAAREITVMFFAINEGVSILENVAELGIPVPEKLKSALLQIRDSDNDNDKG